MMNDPKGQSGPSSPGSDLGSVHRVLLAGFYLLTGSCLLLAGCSKSAPAKVVAVSGASTEPEDSLEATRDTLRQDSTLASCQNAIRQLNAYFSRHPDPRLGSGPKEKDLSAYAGHAFGLDKDERAEVQSGTFTLLDAQHLDMCFLLRDAARSLEVDAQPALDRAAAAFRWVARQVRFEKREGELRPPQVVLRHGRGAAQERALVFAALLTQLKIDGCLVLCPRGTNSPNPQFWSTGALIDGEVYLFDPRMGIPVPGMKEKSIATLRQVQASPDLLASLTRDPNYPYDVSADAAKAAEVYPVCFLSALAPRMKYLEELLGSQNPVVLAVDAKALRRRCEEAGLKVRPWNGPGESYAPTRVLRRFFPPEEGGIDRSPAPGRAAAVRSELVPWDKLPRVIGRTLPGAPGRMLEQQFGTMFIRFYENPQGPREYVLRGRFDEAAKMLMQTRDRLGRGAKDADPDLEEKFARWTQQANPAYARLFRAKSRPAGSDDGEEAREAEREVNDVLTQGEDVVKQLLIGAAADDLMTETTYLLALTMQEQAERAQARVDAAGRSQPPAVSAKARQAWHAAADWWNTFLEYYSSSPAAANGRTMQARALQALGRNDEAARVLQDLSGNLTPLEKTGRLYRAAQLKSR